MTFSVDRRRTALIAEIAATADARTEDVFPWDALRKIKELLDADLVSFSASDSPPPNDGFTQVIGLDGIRRFDERPPIHCLRARHCERGRPAVGPPADPASDPPGRRLIVSGPTDPGAGSPVDEYTIATCFDRRLTSRHLSLLAVRLGGFDFTQCDRFLLTLLAPHLAPGDQSAGPAQRERRLTRRQLQILRLVEAGFTNLQIAHRLALSEGTVRTHLNNIYARLEVSSRTAAVQSVFGRPNVRRP